MTSQLSIELRAYLKHCGLPEKRIAQCCGGTRTYHDLGLYGDIAEAYIEVLAEHHRVDLSGFKFEKFFPPEFAGNSMLTRAVLWIAPFASRAARQRGEYLPLTLEMIDNVIRAKRWVAVEAQ